ncbi:Bax inhibitor-1/YccA family protein [Pseudonocardia thermophila]|uniref:Bax inhibitor-1/YccA family protein n=1 Tax=Pseudonocardia thermophila TaxID=1848 RepID=UPI00093750D3|nr:Bax inhibitor-1/YccA family protein [Pseudonocardia thermophila]
MRTSSNPAFRNLPGTGQGGYATFGSAGAYAEMSGPTVDPGRAGVAERPMTIDDVVTKTAVAVGTAIVAGILTIWSGMYGLALPAAIVGLVLGLVLTFKPDWAKAPLVLLYSAVEGVFLGGITGLLESVPNFEGIGFQAVVGTVGVFIGMLVIYKTGAVRVTPRFTKWLMGAMIGVFVLMLVNLVVSFFTTGGIGLRDGSPLAYLFSLVCIGVAAFSLLLDFDQAERAIRAGAPARFAWYIAFGLMVTLVWLYLEILRLLSYLRGE